MKEPASCGLFSVGEKSICDLQYKGLTLVQGPGQRVSTDAVLLAGWCRVTPKETLCDLGTGVGVIPLLVSARTGCQAIGVELEGTGAALARENVARNGMEDRITIIEGDMRLAAREVGRVQVVCANPPYFLPGKGEQEQEATQAAARRELTITLEEVCRSAASLLGTGGRFYMIHRTERLPQVLQAAEEAHLTPKVLRMVQARPDKDPKVFLLECRRDGADGLCVKAPLLLADGDGRPTEEYNRIYHREV